MNNDDEEVRRWAEAAMSSRPLHHVAPPLNGMSGCALARRESEGVFPFKSKSSAPPAEAPTSLEQFNPSSVRQHAPIEGAKQMYRLDLTRNRPSSMFDTMNSTFANDAATHSYIQDDHLASPIQTQPHLKSCLKLAGSPVEEEQDAKTPIAASSRPNASSLTPKTVHISDDLPRLKDDVPSNSVSSSSASSSTDTSPFASLSSSSTRLVRRNAAHKRNTHSPNSTRSSIPAFVTNDSPSNDSSNLSNATCDSEEDDAPMLVTPLDEHAPPYTGRSPPMNALSDESVERRGVEGSMAQVGSSEPLRLITEMQFPPRRSSILVHEEDSKSANGKEASKRNISPSSNFEPSVPILSHSTLLDIGRETGLTPPSARLDRSGASFFDHQTQASSIVSPISVVSTGLEMGLGLGMASSALSHQMPASTTSGIHSIAEPRFSRSQGAFDVSALAAGLALTESEVGLKLGHSQLRTNATQPNVSGVKSDREAAEPTFEELDRDDTELSRRRTTGGLQSRREPTSSATVGKRRVHRTGTQDPHGVSGSRLPSAHSRHTSLSTMADVDEVGHATSGEYGSSSHASTMTSSSVDGPPVVSGTGSTQLDTPSHGHKAPLSPSIGYRLETGSLRSHGDRGSEEQKGHRQDTNNVHRGANMKMAVDKAQYFPTNNLAVGLMGIGEVGHFGPGVRAKVAQLIESLVHTIPFTGEEDEVINVIEYGALNSRSGLLLRSAISAIAKRSTLEGEGEQARSNHGKDDRSLSTENYFESWSSQKNHASDKSRSRLGLDAANRASRVSFCVTHEDSSSSDFRPMTQMLETHPESYLDAHWQSRHWPCLTNMVFPSFCTRPFASRIAPPGTMHLGISLMDLHWTHTPMTSTVSRATTAQAELTAFLKTRAKEFKKDGVLVLAYIARGEEEQGTLRAPEGVAFKEDDRPSSHMSSSSSSISSTTATNARKDIWTTLSNTLAPCIQRLVSCGMLKSDVARHLLDLPMHPRTARQTLAALKSVQTEWKVEWSCGLGSDEPVKANDARQSHDHNDPLVMNEPSPLRLPHPAWKAFESGCLSRVPFTEHIIQLFKNLYDNHFRTVLRDRGRLSKGAVEFVLDSLWDALFSRIVDQYPSTIQDVEIEVCIYALRRL